MNRARNGEIRVGRRVEMVRPGQLIPAEVNGQIYKPVAIDDPAIIRLGKDIAEKGMLEPIVATLNDVIVSGHRRREAALSAGVALVPVRRIGIRSGDPRFENYLVSFNQQRVKTT